MAPTFHRESLLDGRLYFERELGRLSRPDRKGWMKGRCPFHKSMSGKSFSVHIDGGFYCHGCGVKGGDLVAFVMLRDNCDFKTAAKILGAWREDLTSEERKQLDVRRAKAQYEREQVAQAEEIERARRLDLRDEIHVTAAIYREANERLSELRRGASEAYDGEQEHCWEVLSLALDDLRLTEAEHMRLCGFRECEAS